MKRALLLMAFSLTLAACNTDLNSLCQQGIETTQGTAILERQGDLSGLFHAAASVSAASEANTLNLSLEASKNLYSAYNLSEAQSTIHTYERLTINTRWVEGSSTDSLPARYEYTRRVDGENQTYAGDITLYLRQLDYTPDTSVQNMPRYDLKVIAGSFETPEGAEIDLKGQIQVEQNQLKSLCAAG